jgi:hypothetical protein
MKIWLDEVYLELSMDSTRDRLLIKNALLIIALLVVVPGVTFA